MFKRLLLFPAPDAAPRLAHVGYEETAWGRARARPSRPPRAAGRLFVFGHRVHAARAQTAKETVPGGLPLCCVKRCFASSSPVVHVAGAVPISPAGDDLVAAGHYLKRTFAPAAAGKGRDELSGTIDFLTQYTRTHFIHEEELQMRYGYPDYANHKRFHETFIKVVERLAARLKEEGATPQLMTEINKQMVVWLLNHIKCEDARVAEHIQSLQS